jgi:hypothetical protein
MEVNVTSLEHTKRSCHHACICSNGPALLNHDGDATAAVVDLTHRHAVQNWYVLC